MVNLYCILEFNVNKLSLSFNPAYIIFKYLVKFISYIICVSVNRLRSGDDCPMTTRACLRLTYFKCNTVIEKIACARSFRTHAILVKLILFFLVSLILNTPFFAEGVVVVVRRTYNANRYANHH